MEISQHIKNLLKTNERVILGGFGAFTTKHISASIDKETKIMKPPFKIVVFDADIKEDAGLLAKYMAEKEGISIENSREQIEEFTKTVNSKLENGKVVDFLDLGSFKKSSDGSIEFSFLSDDNLLLDSFGLPSVSYSEQDQVVIPPIKQKPVKEKKIETPVKKEVPVKQKPVVNKPIKEKPIKQKIVKEKTGKKRRWPAVLIFIAAIGVMLAAIYFFKPDLWDKGYNFSVSKLKIGKEKIAGLFGDKSDYDIITEIDTNKNAQNKVKEIKVTDTTSSDTVTKKVPDKEVKKEEVKKKVEEPKTNKVVENKVNKNPSTAGKGKYYIIVSSVDSKSAAQQEQKRFSSKGMETSIIHVPSIGRYRLSLGEFNTAKAAQSYFSDIQKKHGTISAWVWESK